MNVSFPLRDGYFRPLQYTPEDEARWRQLMIDLVALGLHEERAYAACQYERADPTKWKLLREKDQLRVYRARSSAGPDGRTPQNVLAIGTIEGTLEDVIHGVHHVTTQDMRVTTQFLSDDALDSAVIHIFENGTLEDPYRSFAVKWRIIETPGGGLIKNRDGVALEYLGLDVDDRGQRYAFHITETFDHPVCPPFHSACVVRAKAHIRIIYRQVSAGRVGVYFLGDYALCGRIPGVVARLTMAEIAVSVGKSVECTEAKKLTARALTSSPVLYRTMRPTALAPHACSICAATTGLLLRARSMAPCHLCGSIVCAKCRARKHLLSDEKKIPVTCCKKCIVAAKNLSLDPTQPLRLVSAAVWRSQNTIQGDELLWERECGVVEAQSRSSRSKGDSSSEGSWPSSTCSRKASEWTRTRGDTSTDNTASMDSTTTGVSTLSSTQSMGSIDLSGFEEEAALHRPRSGSSHPQAQPARTVVDATPASERERLWRQMNELRVAAERTYDLTEQTNRQIANG